MYTTVWLCYLLEVKHALALHYLRTIYISIIESIHPGTSVFIYMYHVRTVLSRICK